MKKWIWTAGAILLVLLLMVGFQWLAPSFSAQGLTEEEAHTAALAKYPGDIIKTTKTPTEYQIEMKLPTGTYVIKIDAKNGDVLSLVQTAKTETPIIDAPQQTQTENKMPVKEAVENKVITEQEAMALAAKHLKGKADKDDTEFHQIPGQTPYYLVEVKIKHGDDDRKAKVQIDAYTGEVKSVNWDD